MYYFFTTKRNTKFYYFCDEYSNSIVLGTMFSFSFIIGAGLSQLLFFMPDSWGVITEDGDYLPWRKIIGYAVGLFVSIGIIILLEGFNSYRKENNKLKRKIVVNYHLGKLHYATKEERKKMLAKYKREIEELKESSYLLPNSRERQAIFEDVVLEWERGEEWGYDPWVASSLGKDFDCDEIED